MGGTYTLPGVDVVAATGDHGYPGAGVDNYPAAFAGVTAAGGTSLSAAEQRTGRPRLRGVRVVAEQRLGRKLGL